MPIAFECPGCKKRIRCPDQAAGKTGKCPHCGAAVAVPASGVSPGAQAAQPPRASVAPGVPRGAARPRPSAPATASEREELKLQDEGEPPPRPSAPIRAPRVWTVETGRGPLQACVITVLPALVGGLWGWILGAAGLIAGGAGATAFGGGIIGLFLGLALYGDYRWVRRRAADRARSAAQQQVILTGHPGPASPSSNSLAIAMLVIPIVGGGVEGFLIWQRESLGLTVSIGGLFLLGCATVLSTALLAYLDGRKLLLHSLDPYSALSSRPVFAFGAGVREPASTFLVMLALWMIGYPAHFFARRRLGARGFVGPALVATVAFLAPCFHAYWWPMVPPEIAHGKQIACGEGKLIYDAKEITEEQAQAVGRVLTEEGFHAPHGGMVSVGKAPDGVAITFVVKEGTWDDPAHEASFRFYGRRISASAFADTPVVVRLCDRNLVCKKEIRCPSLGKRLPFGNSELYYDAKEITEDQARAVGQALTDWGFFGTAGQGSVTVEKALEGFAVCLVLSGRWDDPAAMAESKLIGGAISGSAFDGRPVTVRLCDRTLTTKKEVRCLSLGKRLAFGKSELFYDAKKITEEQARAVGRVLTEEAVFAPPGRGTATLEKAPVGFTLSFPVIDGSWDDPEKVAALQLIGRKISGIALDDWPVILRLCDKTLTTKKEVRCPSLGKRLPFGDSELYYRAKEITEEQARAVGRVLTEEGYFDPPARGTATLEKATDGFTLCVVVKDGSWDNPAMVAAFQLMGRKISDIALDELPVTVRLCDGILTSKKEVQCPSLGKRIPFGQAKLFYDAKKVTEEQAQAVGRVLTEEGYFGPANRGSVALEKAPDGFTLSLMVKEGSWDDPANVAAFQLMGRKISGIALDERPVTLRLCDVALTFKKQVQCPSLGKRIAFGESEVYYAAGATEAEARAVVKTLTEAGFLSGPGRKTLALSKTAAGFAVFFPVQKGVAIDDRNIGTFRQVGGILSSRAFGGKPVDVHLCDENLITLKVLEKIGPAPARKAPPK